MALHSSNLGHFVNITPKQWVYNINQHSRSSSQSSHSGEYFSSFRPGLCLRPPLEYPSPRGSLDASILAGSMIGQSRVRLAQSPVHVGVYTQQAISPHEQYQFYLQQQQQHRYNASTGDIYPYTHQYAAMNQFTQIMSQNPTLQYPSSNDVPFVSLADILPPAKSATATIPNFTSMPLHDISPLLSDRRSASISPIQIPTTLDDPLPQVPSIFTPPRVQQQPLPVVPKQQQKQQPLAVDKSIPLAVRVSQLPADKQALYHSSTPLSPCTLEQLFALISCRQLQHQQEIPDELVEPLLDRVSHGAPDKKHGSRGGAKGWRCLWGGVCTMNDEKDEMGKGTGGIIKRYDHAKNHVREHCKSKPWPCGREILRGNAKGRKCTQRFLRVDDLKRHQKSHCGSSTVPSGKQHRSRRTSKPYSRDEEEEDTESSAGESFDGRAFGDEDEYQPAFATSSHTTEESSGVARLRARRSTAFGTSHVRGGSSNGTSSDSGSEFNLGF